MQVQQRTQRLRLLALAAAMAIGPCAALAQASGATVVHGQASFATQGNNLTITTANGAGTRHSAINWQSFSVPQGSTTRFNQPDAASTSINRVLGNDPSRIFGTLSSNGRLVLVNPSGITVGQGAVVDTAGFTASTLRMSDADALAGRMRFEGGAAGASLQVDGSVIAQGGDVVLISSNVAVGANALVWAPDGAVVLAAGQSVEITGRGLEGIRMGVSAPTDSAVNLGALEGDAVGMFAGTLRHSGVIQTSGAAIDGGKLQLLASYSSQVDGLVRAGGIKLALATTLKDKENKDDKEKNKGKDDGGDEADSKGKGSDKDREKERDREGKDKERGNAGTSAAQAAAPSPAGTVTTASGPAPEAVASAPAPAQATTSSARAPAASTEAPAAAAATPPSANTITITQGGPTPSAQPASTAAPAQLVVAAVREQRLQTASFLSEPVASAGDIDAERKKADRQAAANDALQCVP